MFCKLDVVIDIFALEDVIGDEVISSDGKIIGELDGIAIDTDTWRAPVVRICLNRGLDEALGVNKPLFGAACIFTESSNIENVSDLVTLSKTLGDLKNFLINPSQVPLMAGNIVGRRAVGRKGQEIGIVESIVFDTDGPWMVRSISVRLGKEVAADLKVKKSLFNTPLISITTKDIRTVGDIVMLSIDANQLGEIMVKA
jgi:sporulation protein YlmC with PRC-barrel domain